MRMIFKVTKDFAVSEYLELHGVGPNGAKGKILIGPTSFSYNIRHGEETHRGVHTIDRTDTKHGVLQLRGNGKFGRATLLVKRDLESFELSW
jgi:hypothetical protein